VQGAARARIDEFVGESPFLRARVSPVEEALAARRPAIRLLVTPGRRPALERIVLHATTLRIPIVEVEGGSLTALAGFDGHQGVALVVGPRRFASLQEVLARADASTLAVLGSGVQARSHLEALRLVRSIRAVRVWSRTPAHARQFARDMSQEFGIGIEPAATGEAAVQGADLIVTATSATSPVLRGEWLSKGAHINAVGAPRPMWRELNTEAVSRSRVFVDSRAGALTEAGDLLIPMKEEAIGESHIVGEIGELLAGRIEGRRGMDDITLFKSLGMAVEDVATAHYVDKKARERGIGEEVTL